MDIKEIERLVMSSFVLDTKEKLKLLSKIKHNKIELNKLNTIISTLKTAEKEINSRTENIVNDIKKQKKQKKNDLEQIKMWAKLINIETKETIEKEKEWNPDDILNLI